MSDWMSEHVTGHVTLEPNKVLLWKVLSEGREAHDFDHAWMPIGTLFFGENQFRGNKGVQGCFGR